MFNLDKASGLAFAFLLVCHCGRAAEASEPSGAAVGIPFTRSYSLDEIGVSRGASVGFDRIGRLAVFNGHEYVVLNDAAWINIAAREPDLPSLLEVATDPSGRSFFGSLANWGELAYSKDGCVRPRSFRSADHPQWVMSTNFDHVVPMPDSVYFGGLNGIARWDRETGEQVFVQAPDVARVFALGPQVFVSSHTQGVLRLDLEGRRLVPIGGSDQEIIVIDQIAILGDGRALVSTTGRRLLLFDGESFAEWSGPLAGRAPTHISCLVKLADGGLAVAIDGRGLYLLSESGECRLALTTPDYRRIHEIVASEPGSLWLATEGSVQRLLYGNPVSVVDQRLGISISWPQVVEWQGEALVATHGDLYRMARSRDGLSTEFLALSGRPASGVLGVAACEKHLLVSNGDGVFERRDGAFVQILDDIDANRLAMVGQGLCLVLGKEQIAALHWDGNAWKERAPRARGLGFPFIAHATEKAAWLELGLDRAARVWLENGEIKTRLFTEFPWGDPSWVSIGAAQDLVVLSGSSEKRLFFDESAGRLREAPELEALLASAPSLITRVVQDGKGTIWASHERGALAIRPTPSGHRFDIDSLELIRENFPLIRLAGQERVWISTGAALYHVRRDYAPPAGLPLQPVLTAIADGRSGEELFSLHGATDRFERIPYSSNSLVFQYFAGGYSSLRTPSYEFTMRSRSQEWSIRSADSFVNLPELREGEYTLSAQLLDAGSPRGQPVVSTFVVEPPWFRAPLAYAVYWASGILGSCGLAAWAIRRTKRKQIFLENLVRERTDELRSTMERLNEEARHAATLAERNRLAGEIHDSLQQGLSGLILQLDATLKSPGLPEPVRSKLAVARKMVSFTRHEVQRAVWDLESPFLDDGDLAEALEKMASLISAGAPSVEVQTSGTPIELEPSTKHHLLRIAQEAITNAARHGKANRISVRLDFADDCATLEVRDDGRGFLPSEIFSNEIGHFGLRGLRGRADKINGDLQILSAPGRGATIRVAVPAVQPCNETAHAVRQD